MVLAQFATLALIVVALVVYVRMRGGDDGDEG
jgi:hypothetical protein